MIRRPPRSTQSRSSAASDVYKRQHEYVEVIIDTPVQELDRPFHYSIPEDLRDKVDIGSLVLVPFTSRLMLAYVVGFPQRPDVTRVKGISRVLDEPPLFDFDAQRLCRLIAARYASVSYTHLRAHETRH